MDTFSIVNNFIKQISGISDLEYGDFKRRANTYICQLQDQLEQAKAPLSWQQKVFEMQNYTQFKPDGDVAQTRQRLLQDANSLLQEGLEVSP